MTTPVPPLSVTVAHANSANLHGTRVSVAGQLIKPSDGPAVLAEPHDVVTSMVPDVIQGARTFEVTGPAVDAVAQLLPRHGFSAGLDVRSGQVLIRGTIDAAEGRTPSIHAIEASVIATPKDEQDGGGFGSF
jgi:hypothetical protein